MNIWPHQYIPITRAQRMHDLSPCIVHVDSGVQKVIYFTNIRQLPTVALENVNAFCVDVYKWQIMLVYAGVECFF